MDSLERVLSDIREWYDGKVSVKCKYVKATIRNCGRVRLFSHNIDREVFLTDFSLVKRLLAVCDEDWKKCIYELPPSKPKYHRQVLDVFVSEYTDDCVILDCRNEEEAKKIQRQLEAQYKIIDIIQRTKAEIDPDWVCDFERKNQRKAFITLNSDEIECAEGCAENRYSQILPEVMYSSDKVINYIVENKLITAELVKQWQGGVKK